MSQKGFSCLRLMIVVCELLSVEALTEKLKVCSVRVGEEKEVQVVTNAVNVVEDKVGKRLVVALEGAEVGGIVVEPTRIHGTMSYGMFCDSKMLGWTGGSVGIAVVLGDDVEIGSSPPERRPGSRDKEEKKTPVEGGLFEKKLTKEEKKKAAKEARELRKAKKEAALSSS